MKFFERNFTQSFAVLIAIAFVALVSSCRDSSKKTAHEIIEYDNYTVKVRSSLVLRSEPNINANKLGNLYNGEIVPVVEIENDWAKVIICENPTRYAYVSARYLEFRNQGPRSQFVTDVDEEVNIKNNRSPRLNAENITGAEPTRHASDSLSKHISTKFVGRLMVAETTTCLSVAEKEALKNVAVPEGWIFMLVVTPELPYNRIFGYAKFAFDAISEGMSEDDSNKLVVFSYLKDAQLLDVYTENECYAYYKNFHYGTFLHIQQQVFNGGLSLVSGIEQSAVLLGDVATTYYSMGTLKRHALSFKSSIDEIINVALVQNILPGTGFWHRWLLGWLFKWPYATARWIVGATGSPWYGLCAIAMFLIVMHLIMLRVQYNFLITKKKYYRVILLFNKIINVYFVLAVTSFMVYFLPSMDNITVMQLYGEYPQSQIIDTLNFYMRDDLDINFWWYILLAIVLLFRLTLDVDLISTTFLNSSLQHKYVKDSLGLGYDNVLQGVITALFFQGTTLTLEKLQASKYPCDIILVEKFSQNFVNRIFGIIIAMLIINSTVVVFGLIFLGYSLIKDIITIIVKFIIGMQAGTLRY